MLGLAWYVALAELPMRFVIFCSRFSFNSGFPWGARYGEAIGPLGDKLAILQNCHDASCPDALCVPDYRRSLAPQPLQT